MKPRASIPRRSGASSLALGLALLAVGSPVVAAARDEHAPGRLLVRLAPGAFEGGPAKHGAVQPQVLTAWRSAHGALGVEPLLPAGVDRPGGLLERFGLDRVRLVRFDPGTDVVALARRLGADPWVEVAHPDWRIFADGRAGSGAARRPTGAEPPTADTHVAEQWHLANSGQAGGTPGADIGAPEAWAITVGRPETLIGLLDTGLDGDHPEFRGRVAPGGWDTANEDADPEDNIGHGSQVWGIAGAATNNGFAVAGVNWRARVVPYKVLLTTGGFMSDLIEGLARLATSGADLANLSLIGYHDVPLLRDAVAAAHAAGVVLVGCNGNDGSDFVTYPAGYAEVLGTGWTDRDDRRAPDSNRTPTLDVVAPGVDVPTVTFGSADDAASLTSGCSFATPSATGVASLLLALDPTLTFEQVRDLLRTTAADEVGDPGEDLPGRDDAHGFGRIDAAAALRALGLASAGRLHVAAIALRRIDPERLDVDVTVLDELNGVEGGVRVRGTLTPPGLPPVVLEGLTASHGMATMTWAPGAALPSGAFTFVVDAVASDVADGRVWAPAPGDPSSRVGDPLLDALHVGAVTFAVAGETLIVEVLTRDDDDVPEGDVVVTGRLTPPVGPVEELVATSRWAAGAIARFAWAPPEGLPPGDYAFDVLALEKDGFGYAATHNATTSGTTTVLDPAGDADADGTANALDNCAAVANADQLDGDADGVGDPCDLCPSRVDPAQRNSDADGAGNRCDCAPYDAGRTGLSVVPLVWWDDPATLRWRGTAGADRYDLLRGPLGALDGADYGACLAEDVAGFARDDTGLPLPGEGYFYLVRGDDAVCGAGPLGADGAGSPRVNTNPAACD